MRYVHPHTAEPGDLSSDYHWRVLRAALEATRPKWGPYRVHEDPVEMNSERASLMLARSETLSVIVRTTSTEREAHLRPVRIPLDKGLIGYRVFFIRDQDQPRVGRVQSLAALREFSVGQGNHWQDARILEAAGFRVERGTHVESLFQMLEAGRFTLFARGINEVGREWRENRTRRPWLSMERKLLVYYPQARYFFFAPTADGEHLARRVEDGLAQLRANGEFERMYRQHKAEVLQGVELSGRRVFRITNPFLPRETPLGDKSLWDGLEAELRERR